jgi:hypothetical protein
MASTEMSGQGATWGVGSAIGTAASTLFGHFVPFVGTAVIASIPSVLFTFAVPESKLQSIVDLVVGQIVTVTLVYGTVQALRGRQVSIGECMSEGLKRLGAALGVAILSGLGIVFGMLLLVVPGLILAAMWAVAVPVATIEGLGVMASLSRSSALTAQRRWRVVGAYAVATFVMVVAGAVVGAVAATVAGADSPLFTILVWLITAVGQAFTACVVATLYYFLRREKEGVDINQIAAVFD